MYLSVIDWLKPLTDEGGKETRAHGKKTPLTMSLIIIIIITIIIIIIIIIMMILFL